MKDDLIRRGQEVYPASRISLKRHMRGGKRMREIKTSERAREWLGTPCLICGKTVQISDPGKAPKVCDKCKAAVLKVRKEMGEDDA